jgi:hypothetical protein
MTQTAEECNLRMSCKSSFWCKYCKDKIDQLKKLTDIAINKLGT